MTKGDLYTELQEGITAKTLDVFFESNVCIQKGDNRHPHADVIHAYAEGAEIEQKHNSQKDWSHFGLSIEYRIKPEPVYEYIWQEKYEDDTWDKASLVYNGKYMTKEEVFKKEHGKSPWHPQKDFRPIKETRLERKL